MIELGQSSDKWALAIKEACRRDTLFFVNTFLWLKEPRKRAASKYPVFPWITWPIQDWWLTEAEESWGSENVITLKTREVGVSVMQTALGLKKSLLENDVDIGLASRNEEKVDSPGDPSSLFGKYDVYLRYLPKFIAGYPGVDYKRESMKLLVRGVRSTNIGYPATGDLNRGGRNTAFIQDEVAAYPKGDDWRAMDSLRAVTDCQIIVSTLSEDDAKAFNQIIEDANWPGKRLPVPWWQCPPMAAGMYTTEFDEGVPKIKVIDETYEFPHNYPFKLDPKRPNKPRSPWYDRKTAGMRPAAIAREFDCDRSAGRGTALDQDAVKRLKEEGLKKGRLEPKHRGKIGFDPETFEVTFYPDKNGPLLLWCDLVDGKPTQDDAFAIGADTSGGTGTSESSLCGFSRSTGRQVFEYANAYDDAIRLARVTMALGKWFGGVDELALVVPECQGPGGTLIKELKNLGYWNIYKREVVDEKVDKRTKKLGWFTPPDGVGGMLSEVIDACVRGVAEIRSETCFAQFGEYVWKDGKIVHGGSVSKMDASHGKQTHGDRAVAAALAWIGVRNKPHRTPLVEAKEAAKYGSSEWIENYLEEQERAARVDDIFNFADVA